MEATVDEDKMNEMNCVHRLQQLEIDPRRTFGITECEPEIANEAVHEPDLDLDTIECHDRYKDTEKVSW